MAIHNLGLNKIKIEDSWEGKSGKVIEDFITRNIITEGSYDSNKETLTLVKGGRDSEGIPVDKIDIPISVISPSYEYGLVVYAIRVDGKLYTYQNNPSILLLYRSGRKIELGIAIRSVANRSDVLTNINKVFNTTISLKKEESVLNTILSNVYPTSWEYFSKQGVGNYILNTDYITESGLNVEDIIYWTDVTDMFKKSFNGGKFTVSFLQLDQDLNIITYTHTLGIEITNEVINLIYNGSATTNLDNVSLYFEDLSIERSNYKLIGYINDDFIELGAGNFTIPLQSGLNQIVIRAIHITNSDIYTDWIKFDIIRTEGFIGTAIAVNGVNTYITNNGVATLYKLVIYSSDREEFLLTTYLEDSKPDNKNPKPNLVVKSETVSASSYNSETNTTNEITYKKYIELETSGSNKYLLIKVNDDFYKFKTAFYSSLAGKYSISSDPYVELKVEECNKEYTYIKTYPISYNYDLIVGLSNNLFITETQSALNATLISDLESSDGWYEREGITYLKLSKLGKPVLKNPINLNLGDSFTLELGFKTYNISDKSKTILNIGNLALYPTQIGWMYEDITSEKFLKRNAQFLEKQDTHVIITVKKGWKILNTDPYYPDYLGTSQAAFDKAIVNLSFNLVRIYINGCIDREIILDNAELESLKNSTLQIFPKSSDIDLYLFRVYNTQALNHSEVIRNYISFLPLKTGELSKESVYLKNDILENDKISWNKCLGKLNTLLFIYHKGGKFPNRFWGEEDNKSSNDKNKKIPCTLIINYANQETNLKYGGILDKLLCKGQGSSAMRYLIWNVNSSLNKFKYTNDLGEEVKANSVFKPYGKLWQDEGLTNLLPTTVTESFSTINKYYPMPPYDDQVDKSTYKYTKMVGKVNFASSMQSHKIGACKLFDDAYKNSLGTGSLPSGGKKAVHEEPFMYFYLETDEEFNNDYTSNLDNNHLTYDKILELGSKAKFMGFLTWGPGKGDDACSGYDEDLTPEYLMLEGGENTDPSVNFLRPWLALLRLRTDFIRDGSTYDYANDLLQNPTVNKEKSLELPWALLLIDDESIVYMESGAWDIDYGFIEDKVEGTVYFDFSEGAKISLKKFREFYDNVYKYDYTYETLSSSITALNSTGLESQGLSSYKKYLIESNRLTIDGMPVSGHLSGDLYRFDEPSNKWVRAGVYYDNGDWERLNYSEILKNEYDEIANNEDQIKIVLKAIFEHKMEEFLKKEDIAFHQAFVKFLSGTDNRAKNTYFQIIGKVLEKNPEYDEKTNPDVDKYIDSGKGDLLIRLIGDDLDTILITDNNGLQSKPYNLLEDSYDMSFYKHWGDVGNLFFRMFDTSYESLIRQQLTKIMNTAGMTSSGVNSKGSYFYNTFFKVLEDFPAIAYNTTATIYYENAQAIKDCGANYGFTYTNNNVEPIAQSHGSCLECEKLFMKERIAFLAGYAKTRLDEPLVTASSAGGGKALKMYLEFEPVQDFYPTYEYGATVGIYKNLGTYNDSNYDILKYKAESGKEYLKEINEDASAINQSLLQVNLYKKLSITGLLTDTLSSSLESTTHFTIDNNIIDSRKDLFGENYPKADLSFKPNAPVLEVLNLLNVNLLNELDLTNYTKLKTLNLSGSITNKVIFPQTGLFESAILPNTIKTFEIYNNPKLKSITFEGYDNIESVYIDCARCGDFNVSEFCENLSKTSLKEITLRNINNLYLTESTILKLVGTKFNLLGKITIVDSLDNLTPKEISFVTKLWLVNTFGDIDKGSNGLIIEYSSSKITQMFTYPQEVNAFYDTKLGGTLIFNNLFDITFNSGNDVIIVSGQNPYNSDLGGYLDIKYSLSGGNSNVTINERTGQLTVTGEVSQVVYVTITVFTKSGLSFNNSSSKIKVNFAWKAPNIGDFAYADGTFSNSYNSNKTLVGIVYNKKSSNVDNGTVYIIGKEYANSIPHYTGFTGSGMPSGDVSETSIRYYVKLLHHYVTNTLLLGAYYPKIVSSESDNGILNSSTPGAITIDSINTIKNLSTNGKNDTKAYVNLVNSNLLNKYANNENVTNINGQYSISSITKLNNLCSHLESINMGGLKTLNSALLFPYFYSMYLYEPSVKPGETLDELYKSTNWYAPSVGELSRIIFLRGYSSAGENFILASSARSDINPSIDNEGGEFSTPIFSIALREMQGSMPEVWENIVGSGTSGTANNIVTLRGGGTIDSDNYSYQVYYNHPNYITSWVTGSNSDYNYYDENNALIRAWSYTLRQGIPFTEYKYSNPTKQ